MIEINNPEVKFALDTVRQAALLVKTIQQEMVTQALNKADRSPVTVADFAAQALAAQRLQTAFPADPLVGEEDAGALRTTEETETLAQVTRFTARILPDCSQEDVTGWIDYGNAEPGERFWTLDPIDGTKGFLRGEQYAVALALIENGKVQVGALACPNLAKGWQPEIGGPGSVLIAQRGKGAWTSSLTGGDSFSQIHVSDREDPAEARFLRSVETGHTNISQLDLVGEAMGVKADPVRLDSQAKYAILASGAAELYFRLISAKAPDYKEKIWDQAAGSLIAEEAGGLVTDLDGKPLDFTQGRTLAANRGVLASNSLLHQAALEALQAVRA